jgi:metal-sulfur cluster biosynthetic enzyme
MKKLDLESLQNDVLQQLKLINDIELPLNIYDLGLIHNTKVEISKESEVNVEITITQIDSRQNNQFYFLDEIKKQLKKIESINEAKVNFVIGPKWNSSMMTPRGLEKLTNVNSL